MNPLIEIAFTEKALQVAAVFDRNINDLFPGVATAQSVGYDLFLCSLAPITIYPGEIVKLQTGIRCNFMKNKDNPFYGLLMLNSGNKQLRLTNGVGLIDCDYTGELKLSVTTLFDEPVTVHPWQKIGQLVFKRFEPVDIAIISEDSLPETERGSKGFGEASKAKNFK